MRPPRPRLCGGSVGQRVLPRLVRQVNTRRPGVVALESIVWFMAGHRYANLFKQIVSDISLNVTDEGDRRC